MVGQYPLASMLWSFADASERKDKITSLLPKTTSFNFSRGKVVHVVLSYELIMIKPKAAVRPQEMAGVRIIFLRREFPQVSQALQVPQPL